MKLKQCVIVISLCVLGPMSWGAGYIKPVIPKKPIFNPQPIKPPFANGKGGVSIGGSNGGFKNCQRIVNAKLNSANILAEEFVGLAIEANIALINIVSATDYLNQLSKETELERGEKVILSKMNQFLDAMIDRDEHKAMELELQCNSSNEIKSLHSENPHLTKDEVAYLRDALELLKQIL